jgi:hypothetical protein
LFWLCAGKSDEHVEVLGLDETGIHVAARLTDLPPRELLEKEGARRHPHRPERFAAGRPMREKQSLCTNRRGGAGHCNLPCGCGTFHDDSQ